MLCPFESETEFWSAFQLRGVVPGGARGAILADQLTLSQPVGTDYAYLITTGTPQ